MTIRTARDAATAAACYLEWLGYQDVRGPTTIPAAGITMKAPGLVARVDPSTRPVTVRDIECLWLHGLSESTVAVCFSLAGYDSAARARADHVGVPLFVLDLTGTPQPVNGLADELVATGA